MGVCALVEEKAGMSYVCRRCDVYGFLPAGTIRACWCCGDNDRLGRR